MAREGVDVEEVVHQLGLEVTLYSVSLVALVHVEDLHPAKVSGRRRGGRGRRQ